MISSIYFFEFSACCFLIFCISWKTLCSEMLVISLASSIFEAIAACHDGGCWLEAQNAKNWIDAIIHLIHNTSEYFTSPRHFMALSSEHFSSSIPNRSNGRVNQKTTLAFQALELLSIFRAQLLTAARTKRPL